MAMNWQGAGTGAASGAAAGASFGPWGAAGGGILGGILGLMSGGDQGMKKLSTMSPEQKQLFKQMLQMLGGEDGAGQQSMESLMGLLDPSSEAYKKFEQPYMQQFEQQTVPGLAERFAGLGGGMGGGLSSSGFGQALSSAGSNLQSQLASMKTGMQSNAANSILGQMQQLLGQQSFAYQPR